MCIEFCLLCIYNSNTINQNILIRKQEKKKNKRKENPSRIGPNALAAQCNPQRLRPCRTAPTRTLAWCLCHVGPASQVLPLHTSMDLGSFYQPAWTATNCAGSAATRPRVLLHLLHQNVVGAAGESAHGSLATNGIRVAQRLGRGLHAPLQIGRAHV